MIGVMQGGHVRARARRAASATGAAALVVAAMVAGSGSARAERLSAHARARQAAAQEAGQHAARLRLTTWRLTTQPTLGKSRSWGQRLADKMTLAGDQLGLDLRNLTFDTLDLDFDGHHQIAHLTLMAGDSRALALHLRGVIAFKDGYAQVATQVDLAVAGKHLALTLPKVDMVPGSYGGRRYVELRLPVFDMHF